MAEAPYHFDHRPGLAGEPTGPIWPRSGEARPNPAYFFFFLCYFCLVNECYKKNCFENLLDLRKL
jgi:hypothetical protein